MVDGGGIKVNALMAITDPLKCLRTFIVRYIDRLWIWNWPWISESNGIELFWIK